MSQKLVTINKFHSDVLGNARKVHIYLPPSYSWDGQPYPVLYVHDGQNVFHTAFNGQSWHLGRVCERLIEAGLIEPLIIVAVENAGEQRNSEFAHRGPHEPELDYACRGEEYEQFLAEELKPYIDGLLHTRPDSANTALMGSSRGGLVTFHIGFNRPDIFGKAAILSPYFAQYNEEQLAHRSIVNLPQKQGPRKIWLDAGGMEGMTLQQAHVREVVERLLQIGYRPGEDLAYYFDPLAPHNEDAWHQRVHAPLLFLFGKEGMADQPVSLELHGAEVIGCSGPRAYVNPVIRFASGLVMTDLSADLRIQPAELGSATPAGLVVPCDRESSAFGQSNEAVKSSKSGEPGESDASSQSGAFGQSNEAGKSGAFHQSGTAVITYCRDGLEASCHTRIVPHLPHEAKIRIHVTVPEVTPSSARIHAGFELFPAGERLYSREVALPHGTGFLFRISDYSGLLETDAEGRPVYRHYVADRDLELHYDIQAWAKGHTL